jgi:hypothetical protein
VVEPKEASTKESAHAKESSKDTAHRFLRFRRNHSQGISARSPNSEFSDIFHEADYEIELCEQESTSIEAEYLSLHSWSSFPFLP